MMSSSKKNNLIILGAGGHGRVVADTAEASGQWEEIAFLDDRYPALQSSGNWPVVGKIADAQKIHEKFTAGAVGIGDNQTRLKFLKQLSEIGYSLPTIIHPSAVISRHSTIKEGTVLFAQSVVNIGAILGVGCIVNTGAKIDHDCLIGNGVHLSPGAYLAGAVNIGDCSWIGIGASVKQEIVIGKNVMVGAGAAVVNNLPEGITAVGVPAKILEKKKGNINE